MELVLFCTIGLLATLFISVSHYTNMYNSIDLQDLPVWVKVKKGAYFKNVCPTICLTGFTIHTVTTKPVCVLPLATL